jgi:uncharacterized membrane protein
MELIMTIRELLIAFKKNIILIFTIILIMMAIFLAVESFNKNLNDIPDYYTLKMKYSIEIYDSMDNMIEAIGRTNINKSELDLSMFENNNSDNNLLNSIEIYYNERNMYIELTSSNLDEGREMCSLIMNSIIKSEHYGKYIESYRLVNEEYTLNSADQYRIVFYLLYAATSICGALMIVILKESYLKR